MGYENKLVATCSYLVAFSPYLQRPLPFLPYSAHSDCLVHPMGAALDKGFVDFAPHRDYSLSGSMRQARSEKVSAWAACYRYTCCELMKIMQHPVFIDKLSRSVFSGKGTPDATTEEIGHSW